MDRSEAHIPFLDGLRGIAILAVFGVHCYSAAYSAPLPWNGWFREVAPDWSSFVLFPATLGRSGVAIFFVVSGFCIHLSHMRSRLKGMSTFFLRRFFRIYPPYFVALAFFLFRDWHKAKPDSLGEIISHVFLFHNVNASWNNAVSAAFWSIAIEVQLYLLYPILLLMVQRFTWIRALWMVAGLEMGLRLVAWLYNINNLGAPLVVTASPFYYWFSWTLGALVADAFLNRRPIPFAGVPIWVFPTALIICESVLPLQAFLFPLGALSTVSLFNLLLKSTSEEHIRSAHPAVVAFTSLIGRHLSFAGIVSYSFYLLHQRLIESFAHYFKTSPHFHLSHFEIFLLCLPVWFPILLISWGFYRLVEQPSIELGKVVIRQWGAVRPLDTPSGGQPGATLPGGNMSV